MLHDYDAREEQVMQRFNDEQKANYEKFKSDLKTLRQNKPVSKKPEPTVNMDNDTYKKYLIAYTHLTNGLERLALLEEDSPEAKTSEDQEETWKKKQQALKSKQEALGTKPEPEACKKNREKIIEVITHLMNQYTEKCNTYLTTYTNTQNELMILEYGSEGIWKGQYEEFGKKCQQYSANYTSRENAALREYLEIYNKEKKITFLEEKDVLRMNYTFASASEKFNQNLVADSIQLSTNLIIAIPTLTPEIFKQQLDEQFIGPLTAIKVQIKKYENTIKQKLIYLQNMKTLTSKNATLKNLYEQLADRETDEKIKSALLKGSEGISSENLQPDEVLTAIEEVDEWILELRKALGNPDAYLKARNHMMYETLQLDYQMEAELCKAIANNVVEEKQQQEYLTLEKETLTQLSNLEETPSIPELYHRHQKEKIQETLKQKYLEVFQEKIKRYAPLFDMIPEEVKEKANEVFHSAIKEYIPLSKEVTNAEGDIIGAFLLSVPKKYDPSYDANYKNTKEVKEANKAFLLTANYNQERLSNKDPFIYTTTFHNSQEFLKISEKFLTEYVSLFTTDIEDQLEDSKLFYTNLALLKPDSIYAKLKPELYETLDSPEFKEHLKNLRVFKLKKEICSELDKMAEKLMKFNINTSASNDDINASFKPTLKKALRDKFADLNSHLETLDLYPATKESIKNTLQGYENDLDENPLSGNYAEFIPYAKALLELKPILPTYRSSLNLLPPPASPTAPPPYTASTPSAEIGEPSSSLSI